MVHSIEQASRLLVKKLEIGRRDGSVTPDHPITARTIAADWNKKFSDVVTENDVRGWVEYAQGVLGLPVYSGKEGYAWCTTEGEWKRSKEYILSCVKSLLSAASKPDATWKPQQNGKEQTEHDNAGPKRKRRGKNAGPLAGGENPGDETQTGNRVLDNFLKEGGATLVRTDATDEEGLPPEGRMG